MSDGFGFIVFFLIVLLFLISTVLSSVSMCDAILYNEPLDDSTAVICTIHLLSIVCFLALIAVNGILSAVASLLSFDIKFFFVELVKTLASVIAGGVFTALFGLTSFIYAMMWYFSTV